MLWKPDWTQAREHWIKWWRHEGPVVSVYAPADRPVEPIEPPTAPADFAASKSDPGYRARQAEYLLSRRYMLGDAFPFFETEMGPGSLNIFLGATPHITPETVWYEPCIPDPDRFGRIRFDPDNFWWKNHLEITRLGLQRARGRYLVGVPDLVEGIDVLAAMRGNQEILLDLVDRPAWVHQRLEEITDAYFQVFDRLHELVRDADNGNAFAAFNIWGPGKTAKTQCDFSAMISPAMFAEFVQPYLRRQCKYLDYSLYHLDGTTCLQHVDLLLEVEELDAIQWTPQASLGQGDNPRWFELYRRILAGGKSLMLFSSPERVAAVLDALGPKGVYIMVHAKSQSQAEAVNAVADHYR